MFATAGCKPAPEPESPAPPTNQAAAAGAPANPPSTITPAAPVIKVIEPAEAKNYVGEKVTVKGKVFRVHETKKGDVFIDVGGKYPDAPFTAVCFQEAIPTEQLKALEGKTVSLTGKIKEYKGRVEIILDGADQISE